MRPEKEYLVQEVSNHLEKSDYVYLANYTRITVSETAELRERLLKEGAEFHVVKNSILNVAAKSRELPDLADMLNGPVAIIVGGNNPSGVAKELRKFFKDKEKVEVKGGVLGDRMLTAEEIEALADLPGIDELRARLLSLLNQPGTLMVRLMAEIPRQAVTVLNGVPTAMLGVLQAKIAKEGGA